MKGWVMREQMESRLETLRSELETGEAEYQQLQARETHLRETLLRISGAVQVLEELLREGQSSERTRAAPNENSVPQLRKE
jgi:light-regulated signal transduction histidine kinase (bacteriophytochrome)